ncbi:hypothetical protein Aab01nite_63240 [Paractinoplanes abujensis]|nr:hypothetical protein Aab01nite_63240 [Actinoplanes abujensis]
MTPAGTGRAARVGLGQRRDGTGHGKTDTGGGATGEKGAARCRHAAQPTVMDQHRCAIHMRDR